MSRTEQRLADALSARADAVREESLRPLTASRPGRGRRAARFAALSGSLGSDDAGHGRAKRWAAPAAAAAAIGLVAALVVILPRVVAGLPGSPDLIAPTLTVAGFPTGLAVDSQTQTIYVSSGSGNVLTMIDARTCNVSVRSGCAATSRVATHGQDPIGVAVDERTHTVYVANGGSGTVDVIDAATCNALDQSGCSARPVLVHVGQDPEFLAVDQATNTIYVANTSSGTVSVIDGNRCDAADTSGCDGAPATVRAGPGAFPIAVDEATDTVYVGVATGVAVIDGRSCNASDTSGCARKPAMIPVRGYPSGIAADDANHTVYISSEDGFVAAVDSAACDSVDTSGCASAPAQARTGTDSRGDVVSAGTQTLYVTNAGSDSVSVISTATCNAASRGGCKGAQPSFPVGASPRRILIDPAVRTVYVVNVSAGTLSMIDMRTCRSGSTTGCPTKSPAGTGRGLLRRRLPGGGSWSAACRPAVTPASSGQPASQFTGRATKVAAGTVAGQPWTLWAMRGRGEPAALEVGGLVLGGRWYGLCAGYPNIAEMELIDAGGHGIAYGFVALPGAVQVKLTSGKQLPGPQVVKLAKASFFVGELPASACTYKTMLLNARNASDSAMHQLTFGSCQAGRVVAETGSDGEWGADLAPWTQQGLGTGPGVGSGRLPHMQDQCSPGPTSTRSGSPAGPLTASSVRVAAGTVGGTRWSLWSSKASRGVTGIEQGGLVLNGRWYGMCPGAPNPAEFELADIGRTGVIYGYVANPGAYRIRLSASIPAPQVLRVQGGTFFIGLTPRSACDYTTIILNAVSGSVDDMHQFSYGGSCRANGLVEISGGQGSW